MFSIELNAKQSMVNSVGVMSFENQMSWSLRPKESVNTKLLVRAFDSAANKRCK